MRVEESVSGARDLECGAERWLCIQDELLRGLAHAISNRLATISAAASVLDAGEVPDARFLDGLRQDAERLEGVLHLLRQLPRRLEAALEPMLLADALDGAQRLVEAHALLRGRAIGRVVVGDVLPVRAEPVSVVHAACVALLAAARRGSGALVATLETIGDRVHLTVRLDGAPDAALANGQPDQPLQDESRVLGWLLAASDGRAVAVPEGGGFSLPTLAASRRRGG